MQAETNQCFYGHDQRFDIIFFFVKSLVTDEVTANISQEFAVQKSHISALGCSISFLLGK